MKTTGKITALCVAVLLALGAAGCSTADTSWAYSLDGERMPAGVYINYMLDAYTEAESKYLEAANEGVGDDEAVTEVSQSTLRSSDIEGKTGEAWITERAQQFALQHYGLQAKFQELGLALDESDEADLAANATSVWTYGAAFYEANGVAESSMTAYLREQKMKEKLFTHLYGKGGAHEISDAELQAEFSDNYVKAQYFRIAKETESADGEADVEAINAQRREQAQGYLDRLKAGERFEDVLFDVNKANADDPDTVEEPEEGANAILLNETDAAYYGTLGEGIMSVTPAEPLLVEDDSSIYVIKHVNVLDDPQDMENYRNTLMGSLKYQDFLDQLAEWGGALSPVANEASISRYTAAKLDLDYAKYMSY